MFEIKKRVDGGVRTSTHLDQASAWFEMGVISSELFKAGNVVSLSSMPDCWHPSTIVTLYSRGGDQLADAFAWMRCIDDED